MPLDKSMNEDVPIESINLFEVLANLESLNNRENHTLEDAGLQVDQYQPQLEARDLASLKLPELEDDPLFRLLKIHLLLRVRHNITSLQSVEY